MKSNKCVILIPIYKEKISCEEYISISNTINLYNNEYDIFFMCSNRLNTYNYDKLFNLKYKKYNYNNIDEYSYILLTKDFYKEYLQYEYMLIAQHDTYIFNKDLLEYYINKGYPYIGGLIILFNSKSEDEYYKNIDSINKIIENLYESNKTIEDLKNCINKLKNTNVYFVGMNGGLSLRKIDILYHSLSKHKLHGVEDIEISILLSNSNALLGMNLFDNILIKDIINFSIEWWSFDLYKKYNIIPFGSHKSFKYFIENIIQ